MINKGKLKIRKHGVEYDKNAIELLGYAFLFYAGSYSSKIILTGIDLASIASLGSLFFYIIWIYQLIKVMLNNTFVIKKIIFFELLYIGILVINRELFPYTKPYYIEYFMFLRQIVIIFLPCGIILSQVKDFQNAFLYLKKYAWIGSLIMLIALPLGFIDYWGDQYWGVQLSPFVIIIFGNYIKSYKKEDLILLILDLILILSGGRQSFLIVFVSCFALYLFDNRKKTKKMLILISIISVAVLMFFMEFYTVLFQGMNHLFQTFGIEVDLLEQLANNKLFDTSTRNIIYQYAIDSIRETGTKISGLFADRYYIRQFARWIAYPHNLFLELWMDFGTVLGTIIGLILVQKVLKHVFIGGEERRRLCIVLSILVFFRLMVSNSFMIEGYFYILLGILFGYNKKKSQLHKKYSLMKRKKIGRQVSI